MITLTHYLVLAALLFGISAMGIFMNRKNVLVLLMSIELMLLAVNFNFIAFSQYLGDTAGQIFVFFVLTVAADALKGVAPILIARAYGIDESVLWMMATLSVVGHCFSPFLKFEGGKGIATGAGVIACFLPLEIAIALATWFIVGKTLKISSVASLAALGALIAASFILHPDMNGIHSHAPLLIIAFIVVYKHAPNIKRLIVGEEKKVI